MAFDQERERERLQRAAQIARGVGSEHVEQFTDGAKRFGAKAAGDRKLRIALGVFAVCAVAATVLHFAGVI